MAPDSTQAKKLKSPVLFLVFNRPGMTAEVFKAIRNAKPERLYVAGDGPRAGVDSDVHSVEETRRIAPRLIGPVELRHYSENLILAVKKQLPVQCRGFLNMNQKA